MSYILGISAFYHDSAACLTLNGKVLAAAQEERFTRIKNDEQFPVNAINFCLDHAGILPSEIVNVVFYEKPFLKFERLLETYLSFAPRGIKSFSTAMPIWIKEKLFQKLELITHLNKNFSDVVDWKSKLLFSEHHLSHAASAFYPSPFKNAAILTLDGVGEWATTSLAVGSGNKISILKEINFPHSIGLLYSAFTYYLGFKVNSGEYKVMGLAPYGVPKFTALIKDNLIDIKPDGSFHLDMTFFDYCTGLTMTNGKFNALFGAPPREPESELTQRNMDIAASLQKVIEEVFLKLAKSIAKETGETNLCLAGGSALNCVANGLLQKTDIFNKIWIQPAAGDAGGALGAALAVWHLMYDEPRNNVTKMDAMNGAYLGPEFNDNEIEGVFLNCGAIFHKLNTPELINYAANALNDQKAIGWMHGRMEFGPRALGSRSILADARSPFMQKQLNLKVKYRESFRPFAPSILEEKAFQWFELDIESPYMMFVSDVVSSQRYMEKDQNGDLNTEDKDSKQRTSIPAVSHVDHSARVQTVNKKTNLIFYKLLSKFNELTGCPLLVNTSFNVRGEPIVCTPEDAYKCFMATELDILIVGSYYLVKSEQYQLLKNHVVE